MEELSEETKTILVKELFKNEGFICLIQKEYIDKHKKKYQKSISSTSLNKKQKGFLKKMYKSACLLENYLNDILVQDFDK